MKTICRVAAENRAAAARCFGFVILALVLLANQCSYMPCRQVWPACTAPGRPAHCPGSARARRWHSRHPEGAAVAVPSWRTKGWERVVGSGDWGLGWDRWGRWVGSEGWLSKVLLGVEPAAPAAKVAPLPKPEPPHCSRRLNFGECFCIFKILFCRLPRWKCEHTVEPAQGSRSSPLELLLPVPPSTPRGRPHVEWHAHNKLIA